MPDGQMSHVFSFGPPLPRHGAYRSQDVAAANDQALSSYLGAPQQPPQPDVGAFLGAQRPSMPQPLTPSQYGNADLDAAAGNPFAAGYGQQRLALTQTPDYANRQQQANQLLESVRGRPVQPGEDAQAMDYYTRWSQMKNDAPKVAPADQHTMTVTNGAQTQATTYGPAAGGGYTATSPAPAVDLTNPQQRSNAIQRVTMGLPFGTQAMGTGPDGQPLTGVPAMQEFLTGAQLAGMSPDRAGILYGDQQRNELLGRQLDEGEKAQYRQVYGDAMKRLQSQPIPAGGRALTASEMQAMASKEADDYMKTFRAASVRAGTGPTDATGKGGAGPVTPERAALDQLGPVTDWLQNPTIDTAAFWRSVLAHDAANQGFMATNGPAILDKFKSLRGDAALQQFLHPGVMSGIGTMFRGAMGGQTDTDRAREALKYYMGDVRRPFGMPSIGGGPVHPDVLKQYPGLAR